MAMIEMLMDESPQDFVSWNPYEPKYFGSNTRSLSFFGEVTEHKTEAIISQLMHLEHLSEEDPITIFLNTEGGSLTDGLAIYDCITQLSCPVIILATGLCSSAGLIILAAGDYRMATPNTIFFYHQPIVSTGAVNSTQDMASFNEHYLHCQTVADTIIKQKSKIKKSDWNKHFHGKTSYYFDANIALSFKMIDDITESKKIKFKIRK